MSLSLALENTLSPPTSRRDPIEFVLLVRHIVPKYVAKSALLDEGFSLLSVGRELAS